MNPEYEAHERLCKSIGDMAKDNEALKQHVTQLENRLRALWDKYEGDRKHYMDRIKRLEEAGDAVAAIIGPPGSAHWADENQVDAAWNNWLKAKEAKP